MGPSLSALEEIQEQIDGVVVTSVFGYQSQLLEYESWCKLHGKLLLFDNAATPIGFAPDARCIHDVGDGSFLSLHETKPLGRGEGGVLFVHSCMEPWVHRALNFGFNILSVVREPHRFASNWRMSDFAAAPICDHLDTVKDAKWGSRQHSLLLFAISEVEQAGFHFDPKPVFPTIVSCLFVRLPLECSDECLNNLVAYLNACSPSVEAKRYYRPLCSREACPVSWRIFGTSICLPFHVDLTNDMISYEVASLRVGFDLFCQADQADISMNSEEYKLTLAGNKILPTKS